VTGATLVCPLWPQDAASSDRDHRGGFGGLAVAQGLRRVPVEVTLLDRRNFHLFQPLLYQVATGWLSPANIASTLRAALRCQKNTRVLLGEVHRYLATPRAAGRLSGPRR
jgi:Pyridine nucleotide-disulphide oxidoreductase